MFASRIVRNSGLYGNKLLADQVTARTGDKVLLYGLGGLAAVVGFAYVLGGKDENAKKNAEDNVTVLDDRSARSLRR
ncbi:hypothetical protein BDN70DRAFT_884069 [Pholiota conissans]|uniref:Uncharacterized protein n=1 Tax=Pholiota conissans TaxID=109636 RepID=A0A9P6CVV7_9AGAR|nr:hypothetical protein BDN70DRAFT_884069 [Pholiota conissans]